MHTPAGFISPESAQAQNNIAIEIYPEAVSYNENAVITIEAPAGMNVAEAYIDGSELGGDPDVAVDTELMEHTVAVADSTTAGTKTLDILLIDEDGNEQNTQVELEVLPREITDDADFDWDEAVIYFLLTDRFMDGDPTNNDPNGADYDTNHPESYHGGDLQGIIDRLDYLEELGINTIWISPIVDNVDHDHRHGKDGSQYGYHGYWAKDFTKIDEHIGDLNTLKELIDEAHDRGIKLMVDVILNHTGYGMKMMDSGAGVPNYPTPEEQAVFDGMLREDPLMGHDVVGEIYGLPDFVTEDPEVRSQIIEWQTDWIERARTDNGNTIDYFRIDTIKHVEDTTWHAFKNELTKIKPDFKVIGEDFGAAHNNTSGYLNSGQMDSLLDFGFKGTAANFTHGNIEMAEVELQKRNESMSNTGTLGHFLSSHDEDGFLHYFMQGDEDLYKVAISLQLTAKGQPVIYYGEEIGLSGIAEGDMDQGAFSENRYDFDWDLVEDHHLVEHYQKVLASRNAHSKIYAKGNREHLAGTDEEGYSIFARTYEGDSVYVGLNTMNEMTTTSFDVTEEAGTYLKDEYNEAVYTVGDDQTVEIELPAYADGGTVLLAVTDEAPVSEGNQVVLYTIIGILIVGAGAFGIWKLKK